MDVITCNFGGQLGNVMFSVYTCLWYADRIGADPASVVFDRSYGVKGHADYIGRNAGIFENVMGHFMDHDEYAKTVCAPVVASDAEENRALKFADGAWIPPFGRNVRIAKCVWHFPQSAEDRRIFTDAFTVKRLVDEQLERYSGKYDMPNSTAIHVRRTDFLTHHGGRYVQSGETVQSKIDSSCTEKVVVFSDDIRWCRENLRQGGHDLVFHDPQEPDFKDMVLMSLFKDVKCNPASTYSYCARILDGNIKNFFR